MVEYGAPLDVARPGDRLALPGIMQGRVGIVQHQVHFTQVGKDLVIVHQKLKRGVCRQQAFGAPKVHLCLAGLLVNDVEKGIVVFAVGHQLGLARCLGNFHGRIQIGDRGFGQQVIVQHLGLVAGHQVFFERGIGFAFHHQQQGTHGVEPVAVELEIYLFQFFLKPGAKYVLIRMGFPRSASAGPQRGHT